VGLTTGIVLGISTGVLMAGTASGTIGCFRLSKLQVLFLL